MATYVQDTFTDTNGTALNAHTPDIGGSGAWNALQGTLRINNNMVDMDAHFGRYENNCTVSPSSADYEVSVDVVWNGGDGWANKTGVLGRWDTSGPHVAGYEAFYDENDSTWYLRYWSSSSLQGTLGTYADAGFTSGTKTLKLGMVGTAIKVYIDGVERISATNSTITAANKGGLLMEGGLKDGFRTNNFLYADAAAASGVVSDNKLVKQAVNRAATY